jgi:hypothetical protein
MPRVVPKRERTLDPLWPPPTPLPPPLSGALRVVKSFSCEGHVFPKGSLLSPERELVQRIYAERPDLLQPAR